MTGSFFLHLLMAGFWSFGAAACCAFVFNAKKADIWPGALFGAAGWVVYLVVKDAAGSEAWGYIWGAFAVALCSEIIAFILKRPATVYLVPGVMPLVPGGGIYTMMHEAVLGNLDKAATAGYITLTAAGSIALSIAVTASISRIVRHVKKTKRMRRLEQMEKSVPVPDDSGDDQ